MLERRESHILGSAGGVEGESLITWVDGIGLPVGGAERG